MSRARNANAALYSRRLLTALLLIAACLWAFQASAQEGVGANSEEEEGDTLSVEPVVSGDLLNNPEYGPKGDDSEPSKADPLKLDFNVRSEIHNFNNRDMLKLDESSDQAIINSDDNATFAYSTLYAGLKYWVSKRVGVSIAVAHNGMWGGDQIGSEAEGSGVFSFYELSSTYTAIRNDAIEIDLKVGRQRFSIGDAPRDYILDDTLDALVINIDARAAGRLRILALDYFSANDLPDASFVNYIGGREATLGLRGDSYTLRTGGIYENVDAIKEGLAFKAYAFYADIGGGPISKSGADISYGGSLGNFADEDWAFVSGARLAHEHPFSDSFTLGLYGEFAYSSGIDRKEAVAKDVESKGIMGGGGLSAEFSTPDFGVKVFAEYYHFDGAEYGEDGLMTNHGFVGFKGKQVGGLLMDRYSGWHPSAYVGSGGIEESTQDIENIGGKDFLHTGIELKMIQKITLSADYWMYKDSASSSVDFDNLNLLNPPFGYSREAFSAQRRLGNDLGQEINLQLAYDADEFMKFYAAGGIFLPGAFQEIEINRVAGTMLGGQETFIGLTGGASVEF